MHRLSLALVLGLAACGSFKDTFTSRRDSAAEAGALKLPSDTLARILAGPRGLRLTKDAATFVTNLWVDYALFAQASSSGKLPSDSASATKALWPEVAELRTQHWHDSLVARRPQPASGAVDSVYNGNEIRVFQHILIGANQKATPQEKAAARKKADATLAKIRKGADFGQLASQLSDDPGSRADQGFLPPSPKGRFVPPFDSAGWKLNPGETSGVVESPFGYHIIKRPSAEAVQGRLAMFIGQQDAGKADSIYMESLARANNLEVAKSAPVDMKAALQNPEASKRSTKRLASFKGGELTVGEYLRWVRALPPQYNAQLKEANDSVLGQFAKVLSLNLLLLRQADSAKVQITGQEWKELYGRYTGAIDSLKLDMGLAGDSAKKKGNADLAVNQYFDKLVTGQIRLRPMPGALGTLLREQNRYRINDPGVAHGLELALAQQQKRDSSGAGVQPPGAGLKPAPGPAPVPGAAPTTPPAEKSPSGDSTKNNATAQPK
jgi:parvulin-like peptidyl-prolyl isomerase